MRIADLPDSWPIAVDTETSKAHPDSGGRVAAVSLAFRVPSADGEWLPSQPMIHRAIPFDQGTLNLPLGPKELDERTAKRLSKWPTWAQTEDAVNLAVHKFMELLAHLRRHRLLFANAKFDMQMLRTGLRGREHDTGVDFEDELAWDTMLASRILWPKYKVGLKETAVRLRLGAELGVKEGMEDEEALALKPWLGPKTGKNADPRFDLVPWSVMAPYAGMDAKLTLTLAEMQLAEFDEQPGSQRQAMQRELDLCKVLYRMENRGIAYDFRTSRIMARRLASEQSRVAERLPFDVTPPKAKQYFFDQLGHPAFSDKITKVKGDPQLDDEVVVRLASSTSWPAHSREIGPAHAKLYAEHEGYKSARSKWYDAWADLVGPDGRLRTSFKQADVVSGRLAVGRAQLQAIPQPYQMPKVDWELIGVRDLFHEDIWCPDGCGDRLQDWEFDLSQAEIRIAAAVARCQPMLDGFLRGDDSHSIACRLMFADLFAADGFTGNEEAHPKWDELRAVAKRCNLGILYSAGSRTIQTQIKLFTGRSYELTQVRTWIDQWNAAFPEMASASRRYEAQALNHGRVQLINGRWRAFQVYEPLHKAFNQMIQGSLAETMKDVMIDVENAVPDSMLLQIHDSLVMRLNPCRVAEQSAVVQKIMKDTYELTFTLPWGEKPKNKWEADTRVRVTVPFETDAKRFGRKEPLT
jgi:DNA polymerase I-like protein with 3'-5' exonuclease and polymerase domains